jgi:hypothetical protein
MTEERKPRSESLLSEIRELTDKVREVRLELEELVKRPPDRSAWRMLSSHGERGHASDRSRAERPPPAAQRPPPAAQRPPPARSRRPADPDHSHTAPDLAPDGDPDDDR